MAPHPIWGRAVTRVRAVRARPEPGDPPRPGDRDLARLLVLLEDDCGSPLTINELRERGIETPAQAIYILQLTGYQIDRIPIPRPNGPCAHGYRLRLQAPRPADPHEVRDDAS